MVAVLHLALGAALLFGLAGDALREEDRDLAVFDLPLPPPPPITPDPPPEREAAAARQAAGAPDLKAKPAPVVAPKPRVRLKRPSPVRTSDERAPQERADRSAGAAARPGPGRGAGGTGDGFGGGGSGGLGAGSGSGLASPPRLLGGNRGRLPSSLLRAAGIPQGQASLLLTIAATGRVSDCRVTAGSGSAALDGELCRIMLTQSRWEPARDRSGSPVTVQIGYTSTWDS
jgi:protein TonB